jgi:hypothetical protein
MTSLVNDLFAEWTHGLDTRESMISIFSHIRDIPYSLVVPMHDPKISPQQLLVAGKGSCGPKHYLLAEMYRKLNLSVVYATIAFSWNDPDLHYPRNSENRLSDSRSHTTLRAGCRSGAAGYWWMRRGTALSQRPASRSMITGTGNLR